MDDKSLLWQLWAYPASFLYHLVLNAWVWKLLGISLFNANKDDILQKKYVY